MSADETTEDRTQDIKNGKQIHIDLPYISNNNNKTQNKNNANVNVRNCMLPNKSNKDKIKAIDNDDKMGQVYPLQIKLKRGTQKKAIKEFIKSKLKNQVLLNTHTYINTRKHNTYTFHTQHTNLNKKQRCRQTSISNAQKAILLN